MWNRVGLAITVAGCVFQAAAPVSAAAITVQLFPRTGEVRMIDRGLGPVPIVFYSIFSSSGALNSSPGVWTSITDTYDLSGNHLVDANNDWTKISSTGSITELSEGVFADPGGSLPPTRSISLGRVWNPLKVPTPDLTFDIRGPDEGQVGVTVEYTLDGDYSGNGVVDFTDYNLFWRTTLGSSSFLLADGNMNGTVDAADYVVWRNNLGLSVTGPPFGSSAGSLAANVASIPEPATVALLFFSSGIAAGSVTV